MDANHTANGKPIVAPLAVFIAFVSSAAAARAEVLIQTPSPVPPAATRFQVRTIEEAADGNEFGAHSPYESRAGMSGGQSTDDQTTAGNEAEQAAILAAILLIPPPIDLITEIPVDQPDNTHPIVVEGPDLHIDTIPGGTSGQVLNTQSAPEPTTLLLGAIGSSVAFASAWCRRRRLRRRAQEVVAVDPSIEV